MRVSAGFCWLLLIAGWMAISHQRPGPCHHTLLQSPPLPAGHVPAPLGSVRFWEGEASLLMRLKKGEGWIRCENCLWWLKRIIFNTLLVSNKQMKRALQIVTNVLALLKCMLWLPAIEFFLLSSALSLCLAIFFSISLSSVSLFSFLHSKVPYFCCVWACACAWVCTELKHSTFLKIKWGSGSFSKGNSFS